MISAPFVLILCVFSAVSIAAGRVPQAMFSKSVIMAIKPAKTIKIKSEPHSYSYCLVIHFIDGYLIFYQNRVKYFVLR